MSRALSATSARHAIALAYLVLLLSPGARTHAQPDTSNERPLSALDRALLDLDADLDAETSDASDSDTRGELDQALDSIGSPPSGDLASYRSGNVLFRLMDVSMDLLFAVGASTERDASIANLQGGGHDPRKRGFTLQNLELALLGAVDPFFTAEVNLIYFVDPVEGESIFELEEAFFTTQMLPFDLHEIGFALEAGQSFTEFGRINPRHPHSWDFVDQPVILGRIFGPDGMRGLGARLGWLAPLPFFSELHVGVQNAGGETMSSFLASEELFEERPVAGLAFSEREARSFRDLVWLGRWESSFEFCDEIVAAGGLSTLWGPNASGSGGSTSVHGADLLVKWRPLDANRGWPFLTWQSEIVARDYRVDRDSADLAGETVSDLGLYSQVLWGFERNWALGFRYEFANGAGPSVGPRSEDPFRDRRQRFSPLIEWIPTHFSRVRLQYNYDRAQHLESDDAHSLWLGFEVLFGEHAAHTF